jgi:hypothetical protein
MATWAERRKAFFVVIFSGLALALITLFAYPYFNKPPTCIDGLKNGTETGVDCGGECARACLFETEDVSLLWARAFRVVPGRYNAVAYLENKNQNVAAQKVSYRFRFADSNNVFIGKREGETFIPPAGRFAIFAPAIDLGNSIPVYTTFEFTSVPDWVRLPEELVRQLNVTVTDAEVIEEDVAPKLFANVRNNSLFKIPEVSVVAILYDSNGNVLNASSTYLEVLDPETIEPVSYTWPEPFEGRVIMKELIPYYDLFKVAID